MGAVSSLLFLRGRQVPAHSNVAYALLVVALVLLGFAAVAAAVLADASAVDQTLVAPFRWTPDPGDGGLG